MQPTLAALIGLPPPIGLFGGVVFVCFLFRRDFRQRPNVTSALWLPTIWVMLIGSRSVSQWLDLLHFPITLGSVEEGNPLDAFIYLMLIVGGIYVLDKRRVSLSELVDNNGWVVAFLLYCFVAIFWSDFPFVAFKRWIKVLGHPVMALILFTEPDPEEALIRFIKRTAYVLLTFSIVAIKWYPDIGRRFDEWSGIAQNCGISQNKNGLGCVCLVVGYFLVWDLIRTWHTDKGKARRDALWLLAPLLLMDGYLLRKSHDATATLCFAMALAVIFLTGRRWLNKKLIGLYVLAALAALGLAQLTFGIFELTGDLTGHSATLMGRMQLWRECLELHTNPLFGVGFESFWLGDRLHLVKGGRPWQPNEAHNGYLEIYLNMGWVGLFMLFGLIIATFRKIRFELLSNPDWPRFELGFLAAILCYNLTESTFRGLSLTWFIFFVIAIRYPRVKYEPASEPSTVDAVEEEALIYTHE